MASACGKVILLGEHAVVYGVPAIAAGIERGARARAERSERATLSLANVTVTPDDGTELGRALSELLASLDLGVFSVALETELPIGCGLGSSAAMAVATARAVLEAAGEAASAERVQTAALAFERVFHGNPSGIDTAAAAEGGCIWFTRAEGHHPIAVGAPLHLAIAVAGPAASTKSMVDAVARLAERRPEVFKKSLDGIHSLVKNARLAIEAGDVDGLGKLLDLNQMLLAGLHVSTEEIERACQLARDAGALGAKLTGAGGGGAVVALTREAPDAVLEAWRREGLTCFATAVGAGREPAR